jgi:hypothetical protein
MGTQPVVQSTSSAQACQLKEFFFQFLAHLSNLRYLTHDSSVCIVNSVRPERRDTFPGTNNVEVLSLSNRTALGLPTKLNLYSRVLDKLIVAGPTKKFPGFY